MGIFDALKNAAKESISKAQAFVDGVVRSVALAEPEVAPGVSAAYFKNGRAYKFIPAPNGSYYDNRDTMYHADVFVSDGDIYDLRDAQSISSIKIPQYDHFSSNAVSNELGVCGYLDYALRMKAGRYFTEDECELCSACLWKCTELMFANEQCGWSAKDYMRLVFLHYEMDMPQEAERALAYLEQNGVTLRPKPDSNDDFARNTARIIMQRAQELGCDLVAFHDYGSGCCEKCATMTGRVYSLSGKDIRFPILPEYVREHGNFHEGCRCQMSVFFDDQKVYHHGEQVDPVFSSMRSYVDDRTDEEYERYNHYLKAMEEKEAELEDRLERSILRGKNRKEFMYFKENHPDIAPKTIDGYIKGKKTQSKKFKQLLEIAKADGFKIEC